jgi:nucleotide-binding universal stress UspA family protein
MKANVFHGSGQFGLEERPIPTAGVGETVIRVRLTTICRTDIHIVRSEYPVRQGPIIGHEAVGVRTRLSTHAMAGLSRSPFAFLKKEPVMLQIQEILFPVDFSERCCAAARHAAEMASHFQAKLTLLHVIAVPTSWYGEPPPVEYNELWDLETVRKQRQITLNSFLGRELGSASAVERIVEQGDPPTVIADYAKSRKPGLIMRPTHGHGPLHRLLLGSVTAKVLHDVRLPVWTTFTKRVHSHGAAASPSSAPSIRRRSLCNPCDGPRASPTAMVRN